jgi:hypothetical protein
LLALCACDQVFGLTATRPVDATFFDAPLDAAPTCNGTPQFSPLLHQAVFQACLYYTTSEARDLAAAACGQGSYDDYDGAVDQVLSPATFMGGPRPGGPELPRLTPEGDELWGRFQVGPSSAVFSIFTHSGEHQWSYSRDLPITNPAMDDSVGTPTRKVAGVRHFIYWDHTNFQLVEYLYDGTTASLLRSYTPGELASSFVQFPQLSPDGLRLIFTGSLQTDPSNTVVTLYTQRATIADVFPPAVVLNTAPVTFDPFLTADCGRLYTSGLGSIFYAQQQ